jgi:hydrogenase nickel incorporation protein HypA/HybF
MHERSLVARLIEQIDDELQRRELGELQGVHVSIGEFAGIEPALLTSAFEELAIGHWQRPIELKLDVIPLTASCERCGTRFRVERFQFACPECQSGLVDVIQGEELKLVSLMVDRTRPMGRMA